MIYITGDTHGDFSRLLYMNNQGMLNKGDIVIVLGDAGLNYDNGRLDYGRKTLVSSLPCEVFCIHGNHERRPHTVNGYEMTDYHGGKVWAQAEYPNIFFAKDGEIYDFDGLSCIVIGGAYSVDKFYRLFNHMPWFADEQPDDEIKVYVEKQLEKANYKVDVVLSHTCPYKYEPREVFLKTIDQSNVDKSTELWLGKIENKLDYKKWYCGHFHTEKKIDKIQFMFEEVEEFGIK